MTLDANTRKLIEHQYERRAFWMAQVPPDRKEAAACLERINAILDRRPGVYAVTEDGETIYEDASPWEKTQLLPPGLSVAVNAEGTAEPVLPAPNPHQGAQDLEAQVMHFRRALGL